MNYANLSKTQKRVIDAFIKLRPELTNASTITRSEVEDLFSQLMTQRANGGEKIGYPMWLVKGPKAGRGVYIFPAPNVDNTNAIDVVTKRATVTTKEDEEFMAELRAAGIEV